MYLDFKVKIPYDAAGITRKKIKGITYIYYAYEHNYNPEKRYTIPRNTSIIHRMKKNGISMCFTMTERKAANMRQLKQRLAGWRNVSTSMKEQNTKLQEALPDTLI